MPKREIFNATTQQVELAELSVDKNNEIVATFEDGSFLKFPAGLTSEEFAAQIAAVQVHNEGQEVITPEMEAAKDAEREASLALIGAEPEQSSSIDQAPAAESEPTNNANTMAPEDKTNATDREFE